MAELKSYCVWDGKKVCVEHLTNGLVIESKKEDGTTSKVEICLNEHGQVIVVPINA